MFALASTMLAQGANASSTADTTSSDGETLLEAVTVTGTRIIRDGSESPTPVTIVSVEELNEITPSTLADALNKLPQFSVQFTPQSNANGNAPSGNFLNLRGLGQGRTLVMMDGVRVPGTSITGTVDVNTLPQALVQRVEIVTGGASAIYGSDAVGGVVNYILNSHFNGIKGSIQGGLSTYGDAASKKISLAFGTPVFGSGHFEFSYEHNDSSGISQADRSYTSNQPGYTGLGTAASPYVLGANVRMSTTTLGGYIQAVSGSTPATTAALSTALLNKQFGIGGGLAPFNAGTLTGSVPSAANTGGLQIGGDGAYFTGGQFLKPVNTDNLFGRFDYDLGSKMTAYLQVADGLSKTNYIVPPAAAISTTVISGNPFLPAAAQTALTAASTPTRPATFTMSSLPQNLIQMQVTNQRASDLAATLGLKGTVFDNRFSWNTAYTHGEGKSQVVTSNNINTSNFYAALDAVAGPNGPVCFVSTTANASLYPGCTPLNFIGAGYESPAALSYIFQDTGYEIVNKTDDFTASVSGTAFNNWAGAVSVATNAEYRWSSLTETSTVPAGLLPQLTGLRTTWVAGLRGATPSTPFLNNTAAPQYGADGVWEVGGETVVPLLKDLPLAKSLDFNGAVRYTEYSVSGPATTWKVGLTYQPINDLRFRATESHDIRAPNLFELFQAPVVTTVSVTDPLLNNATYTVNQYAQGDINVQPEEARSYTFGFVYSPSWLPRFHVSVDYYYIDLKNAISQSLPIGGGVNLAINTCIASGGTSAYCLAVPRPFPLSNTTAANQISAVYNFPINLAEQYIEGADVELGYSLPMAAIRASWRGNTDVRLLVGYEPTNATITNAGALPTDQAGASTPFVRATATLNYSLGAFKTSWQSNYTGPHTAGSASLTPTFFIPSNIPPVVTDDLSLRYTFKAGGQGLQLSLTVNNIFNQSPALGPPAPTNLPGAQTPLGPGAISPLGRYFTAGLRLGM
jgi:iron complex outermembrane receptor protein